MPRFVHVLSGTIAATIALSGQAFAHAHLKAAVPADKAVLKAAPTELDLTFSEELNLKFSSVAIAGPGGKPVKAGVPMLMNGDATLMVPVTGPLGAGSYTVQWHVLSADGHKTKGKVSFTIKP
jgi:methionine-rich copper-binding protein CopC